MKEIDEIGLKKSLKFLVYSGLQVVYHNVVDHFLFIPPARKLFLQVLGAKIGKSSVIMNAKFFNWHHTGPGGLSIGNECYIGDESLIDLYDRVTLEDQVTLAQKVTVLTHLNVGYQDHPLQKFFPKSSKPVIFKNGCVIGANSTVLPGVAIGSQSFVAAGSVVIRNVPANSLVAGVPAKLIRKLK